MDENATTVTKASRCPCCHNPVAIRCWREDLNGYFRFTLVGNFQDYLEPACQREFATIRRLKGGYAK